MAVYRIMETTHLGSAGKGTSSKSRYLRVRARVYELFDPKDDDCLVDRIVNIFIVLLILLNVLAVILGTVSSVNQRYHHFLASFELFSIIIFSAEYLLRAWSCVTVPEFAHSIWGRLRYLLTPMAIFDLLAILPFFTPLLIPYDLRVLRAIRLFRVLRILKVIRYSESLKTLSHVFREKRADLSVTMFFALILLIIASSLVYFTENPVQPDKFPDIPSAMWWGVVTLTTVGYGDVFPVTALGKFLGGVIAFLGIGLFALPAGILGSGFVEEMQQRRLKNGCCPHCGRPYKENDDHEESSIFESD